MKKHIFIILSAIVPTWLFAEPIDSLDAKQVASPFMHNLAEQSGAKSGGETDFQCLKDGNIFILNNTNGGWALVSADDCVRPILAYSPEGEFSIDNIAPAAKDWFDNYNEQIEIAQKIGFQRDSDVQKEWKQLRNGRIRKEATQYVVEPLIETKWAQGPYYNKYCPTIDGQNALTGCVATAMAQVMNYWQWPKKGQGFHEYKSQNCGTVASVFGLDYEWGNMPEQLGYFSSDSSIDAVANIMYDCGVSVDMNYGLDGSGIRNPETVKDAMVRYFKYSPNMTLEFKDNYEDEKWIDKLKNELVDGRPILYYGYGDGGESGHAFICDGYAIDNSNYYFHFNWGWSGSCDGYYLINSLEPTDGVGQSGSNSSNTYNDNQQAYFGVKPFYEAREYDLQMYNGNLQAFDENANMLTFNEINTLWLGNDTYYYAKIANYGNIDFSGNVAVAIFDENDRFVSLSNEAHINLQPNYYTTNDIEFKIDGTFNYSTNKYYIATIVYKDDYTEDWSVISDINSMVFFNVNYSAAISIDSPIMIFDNFKKEEVSTQEFINGDEYTCTVRIKNTGYEDYMGRYVLSLTNTKGEFLQELGTYEQKQPLKPNEVHNIMFQDTINVEAGSYILVVSFWSDEGWIIAGAVNGGDNPILFDVKEEYLPDKYEDNNTVANAYVLPLEFNSDDEAEVLTIYEEVPYLTNLHKYGDVDYYKFDLKSGYNYNIEATILNNNDGLGVTTADDVTIEYSYDGKSWQKGHGYEYRCKHAVDSDDRCDELEIKGGGNVYVKIYHPWGMKGTYVFAADVSRYRENQGGNENNPGTIVTETAANAVNIYAYGNKIMVENATDEIRVYDAMGRLVCRDVACRVRTEITVNTTGVYIVKTGATVKRVIIK